MSEVVLSKRAQLIWDWIQDTLSTCGRGQGEGCEVVSLRTPHPTLLPQGEKEKIPLRQQTLAELFGCSRRTIGRCLTELKAAGLLVDTGKRENRVKVYGVNSISSFEKGGLRGILIPEEPLDVGEIPPNLPFPKGGDFVSFPPNRNIQPPSLRIFPGETLNPHAADYWQLYYFTIQCNLSMFDGKNGRPLLEDVYVSLTQRVTGKTIDEIWRNLFDALYAAPYYWPCRLSHSQEQGSNMFEWLEAHEAAIAQEAIEKWQQNARSNVKQPVLLQQELEQQEPQHQWPLQAPQRH